MKKYCILVFVFISWVSLTSIQFILVPVHLAAFNIANYIQKLTDKLTAIAKENKP